MDWVSAKEGFITADVVRFDEQIWPRRRRRRQNRPVGHQEVTGQITDISGDYVSITVMKAELKESLVGAELKTHKAGSVIRKKRATLQKARLERLLWSDESARAALTRDAGQKDPTSKK